MDALRGDREARTRRALLNMLEDLKREREVIREARRQWIETVDSVRDPLMVHDDEGRIVRANRAYAERSGMAFRELIGRPYWQCFPKRGGPLPLCAALHLAPPEGPRGEEEVTTEDGRIFVSRAFGVGEAPPQAGHALHLFEDVTERRRAEEKTRVMTRLVESSPAVVFRWRPEPGWPVDYVSENVSLWGYGAEELTSGRRSYAGLVHPEDLERVGREVADYTERKLERFAQEYRIFTASGKLRWVDDRTVVERDAAGAVRYYQGVVIDITERRRAEGALRESERRLATLMANLPGMAYRCTNDPGWTMEFVSEGCRTLTGYAAEDLRGSAKVSYGDLIVAEDRDAVWQGVQAALAKRRPFELNYRILTADGRTRWVWEQGTGVYSADGTLAGLEGFIADVTERKRLADAAEARARRAVAQAEALGAIAASPALAGGDIDALAREVTEAAARCAGVERSNAWLFNEDETELRCIDGYEATPARHSAGMVLGEAQFANEFQTLKQAPYVNADDPLSDPRTAGYVESYLKPLGITSMLDVVVQAGGRHLGLLCLEHVGKPHHWEEDEIAFTRQLADKIALAIVNRERRLAHERLRESEARFRSLTELSSDFYWETDAEHRLVQRGSGGKPSAVGVFRDGRQLGKRRWELPYLSPGDAGWRSHRADLEAHRPVRDFEFSRKGDDGSERFISISGDPIVDDAGAFRGYRGVGKDVTERKRIQRELEQNEARFRSLMEHASDLVVLIDRQGIVRYASPSLRQLGGYEPQDVLGAPFTAFMHPEDAPVALRNLAALVATPGSTHAAEFRYRCKDGRWIVLASMAKNALDDPAVQGVVLNARDVTEHRRFEDSLRQANRALRTLSAGNEALVRAADEAGLLAEMTRILTQIGGYPIAFVVYARDDAQKTVEPMACAGIDERVLRETPLTWAEGPSGQSVVARAVRTGETQLEVQAAESPAYAPWREFLRERGVRFTLGLPLRLAPGRRPFGAVGIAASADDPFDAAELKLLEELAGDLGYGIANLRAGAERRQANEKLRASLEDTIGAIAATMETRDPYTAGHQRRVAELAAAIAAEMGLAADTVQGIHFGALIHDLGKIQIPAELLVKPTRLSKIEFDLIKTHPQAGYDIIKGIDFPWPVAAMVHQHHERLDGSGYPQGLKGEAIALEARILAIADVVEAMASHRPYRPGLGIAAALQEIEQKRGKSFDAAAVDACLRLFRERGYAFEG